MTESEAKTKWCPKLQLSPTPSGAIISNRDQLMTGEIGDYTNCIASGCMWWVWDGEMDEFEGWKIDSEGHCGAVKS